MKKRRKGSYSYQKLSYESSCERDRKRKRRKITIIVTVVVLILLLGAGGVAGVKLLQTKGLTERGTLLTSGPAQGEGSASQTADESGQGEGSASQMSDGSGQGEGSESHMEEGPRQVAVNH